MTAPEHCSPENILNALNDHCIQEIFTHLQSRVDFLNAAEVCKRFQENVIKCYPSHLKRVIISNSDETTNLNEHPSRTLNYLAVFGHLIEAIDLNYYVDKIYFNNILPHLEFCGLNHFKWVTENCAKTLVKLHIGWAKHLQIDLNSTISEQFQTLENFTMHHGTILEFGCFAALKSLALLNVKIENCAGFSNSFPKLEEVTFRYVNKIDDDVLIEFQRKNPQVQELVFRRNSSSTSRIFHSIDKRMPNLVKLKCNLVEEGEHFKDNMIHISKLTQLNYLQCAPVTVINKEFIDSLADFGSPIEYLAVFKFHDTATISRLHKLRRVLVRNCDKRTAIDFIKNIPSMRIFGSVTIEQFWDIFEILNEPNQLTEIHFNIEKRKIDLEIFNRILKFATNRIKISLQSKDGTIDVDLQTQYKSRNWLTIF